MTASSETGDGGGSQQRKLTVASYSQQTAELLQNMSNAAPLDIHTYHR